MVALQNKLDWHKLLRLDKKTDGTYDVMWGSDDFPIGETVKEIDGYFYFQFNHIPYRLIRLYDSSFFRALANMLDELNEEWDEQVKEDMK